MVGLPKTIDNDVIPIRQSLGAWTAAEQGARFAQNIIGEHNSGSRMLIVHEVMGRHCGWLTAATAQAYREWLDTREWLPEIGLSREAWDVHGVYVPEAVFDLEAEAARLKEVMDQVGSVNLFLSEGAGLETIVAELERSGEEVDRDPFGHVKIDKINPGAWFASKFAERLGCAEGDGAEVGVLLPLGRGQPARPGADPVDDRPRRRLRAARRARRDRARRGARRRAAGDRVRPDQGRQAVRHQPPTGSPPCWTASASPRPRPPPSH